MACCLTRKVGESLRLHQGNKKMWLTVVATRPGSCKIDIEGREFTLYQNKSIQIGTNDGPIWIDLTRGTASIAKLAIDAPPNWGIMRQELLA